MPLQFESIFREYSYTSLLAISILKQLKSIRIIINKFNKQYQLSNIHYQMHPTKIRISQLVNVCTHLAFEAANIIKNVKESSNLNILLKEKFGVKDDPVTQADFKAQTLILKGLRKYWPQLQIVGEEQKDYEGVIDFDFKQLEKQIFDEKIFSKGKNGEELQNTLDIDKTIVFVDPLDGTLSYTQGYLDEVTTLIGISYEGKAKLGIIGVPYVKTKDQESEYKYQPNVYVADKLLPHCYAVNSDLKVTEIGPRKHNKEDIRLVVTRSKITPEALQIMQSITKNIRRSGGMGKKAMDIVLNSSDAVIYLGRGISSWDVCAAEAIISSVAGGFTKADGSTYEYALKEDYLIPDGCIVTVDEQLHKTVLEKISTYQI